MNIENRQLCQTSSGRWELILFLQLDSKQEAAASVDENTRPPAAIEGLHNSHDNDRYDLESTQMVEQGEAFSPQQQRPDTGEQPAGQSWFADEQATAFRENPILRSCYVPTVGGSYAAVTLESNYGSSEEKDDWWPPALQEEEDSALEELQAIASALEETYTQVPNTTENPCNSEVEAQDIPRMKLLF